MSDYTKNCEFNSIWAQGTALYVQWANKHGIGYPKLMVLYALDTLENLTQKEIREGFGLLKQTVNTIIRDLKNKDYVILQPSKEDKREKLVILTETGKLYSHKIIEPLLEAEDHVYKKIGYERITQTMETMDLFNLLFEKEVERSRETHE